jgi:cellulose synthase (UDP-forming)
MLIRNNVLGFEFIGHYTLQCGDPASTALWSRINNSTSVELSGSLLPLGNDLKNLPLPFYDGSVSSNSSDVPFAFMSAPSPQALQAAGIIASWFGLLAKSRPLHFPANVGANLPRGKLILLVESPAALPPGLDLNGRFGCLDRAPSGRCSLSAPLRSSSIGTRNSF